MSGNRLGGRQGTAYTGTNAAQPPNWNFNDRDPNQYDSQNYALGDLWLNQITRTVWILVSLAGDSNSKGVLADWEQFGGDLDSLTGNSGGTVFGDALRNINVLGDTITIDVVGNPATNTLTISTVGTGVINTLTGNSGTATPMAGNINIITANSTPIFVGAADTLTLDFGLSNLILGSDGSTITIGALNNGFGLSSLASLTSGNDNCAFGYRSLTNATQANDCSVFGHKAAENLLTGTDNIIIGSGAGSSYNAAQSNNIIIGSIGNVADSGTTRIGTNASQTSCFVAGIDGVNVGNVATVVTEASDKLGTAVITAGAGITVTPGANSITIAAPGGATRVSFLAYLNTAVTNVTGDGTNYQVIFDTITFNTGSGYSNATGIFTAPITGVYIFTAGTTLANLTDASFTEGGMYISQFGTTPFIMSDLNLFVSKDAISNVYATNGSVILSLTATQTVSVFVYVSGVSKTVGVDGLNVTNRQTFFAGSLLI